MFVKLVGRIGVRPSWGGSGTAWEGWICAWDEQIGIRNSRWPEGAEAPLCDWTPEGEFLPSCHGIHILSWVICRPLSCVYASVTFHWFDGPKSSCLAKHSLCICACFEKPSLWNIPKYLNIRLEQASRHHIKGTRVATQTSSKDTNDNLQSKSKGSWCCLSAL